MALSLIKRSLLVLVVAASPSVAVSELIRSGQYEVTTETGMPHLEESLRYSTTRETRCLTDKDLPTAFAVLAHSSLRGCRLAWRGDQGKVVSYDLLCEGGYGTTGEAVWDLSEHQLKGTLRVKLGGKNMTFYQRVTAIPLDKPCTAALSTRSRVSGSFEN